jgi:hypothetical protein
MRKRSPLFGGRGYDPLMDLRVDGDSPEADPLNEPRRAAHPNLLGRERSSLSIGLLSDPINRRGGRRRSGRRQRAGRPTCAPVPPATSDATRGSVGDPGSGATGAR